jgi:hypothetical protein
MIDLFLQDLVENKEHFNSDNEYGINWFLLLLLWLVISCCVVYLSWNCKTNQKLNTGFRILYAILAFIFWIILYWCIYVIIR